MAHGKTVNGCPIL